MAAEIVKLAPFELLRDSNPNTGIPTVKHPVTVSMTKHESGGFGHL